eukprot:198834_1
MEEKQQSFKIKNKQSAEQIAMGFFGGVLNFLNNGIEVTQNHEMVKKFLCNDYVFIQNGHVYKGIGEWISFYNKFVKIMKKGSVNYDLSVEQWHPNQLTYSFSWNGQLINNQHVRMRGSTVLVLTDKGKLSYTVETGYQNCVQKLNQQIAALRKQ